MLLMEKKQSVFQRATDMPKTLVNEMPCIQTGYLINGEIRSWKGPRQEVLSPVWVADDTGLKPFLIGEYPLLTEKEAFQALDAAVTAFGKGWGLWPNLSLAERIDYLEMLVFLIIEEKDRVMQLLMWEIRKSFLDSEKEFDRTMEYIIDTLTALRNLDQMSSRLFTIEGGIIGQIQQAPMGVALCTGPFNYPLIETFRTLIPPLVLGNTVILIPPKDGALIFATLIEAFGDIFPKGVINVIYGEERQVLFPIMASDKINVLGLIGGGKATRALKKQYPPFYGRRCLLEFEPGNLSIVLNSGDTDLT